MKPFSLLGTALAFGVTLTAVPAAARDLTIVSFGGALQDAIRGAFIRPFAADTKAPVIEDSYTGALSAIAAQVMAKSVTWDVVDVDSDVMASGCEQGYFEKLDWSMLPDKSRFLPAAVNNTECGVGFLAGALVMGYDATKFTAAAPKTWADFWDVARYPGKRGMRQDPRLSLEVALMADGVAPADIYPLLATPAGVDRAFRKLETLKPHITWWTVGAQSVQALASGEVTMSAAYSGRLLTANRTDAKQYVLNWEAGSVYFNDYWGIPKGSANRDAAMKFIASTADAGRQLAFAKASGYGPTLLLTDDQVDAELRANVLTPDRLKFSVPRNDAFWTEQTEELTRKFNIWASK